MLVPRLPSAAPHVALESHVTSGFCSVMAGWSWGHSLCVPFRLKAPHKLILCLIAPFPWCIWFIRLLLTLLTHAHLLHPNLFHLTYVLPGPHRIRCKARKCPCDWGVSSSGNGPPVYCIWGTLLCYIRFTCLESWSSEGFWGLDRFPFVHSYSWLSPFICRFWWVSFRPFVILSINVPPIFLKFFTSHLTHIVASCNLLTVIWLWISFSIRLYMFSPGLNNMLHS